MDWFWTKRSQEDDDEFVKRPRVSARQRAIEEESIAFINERNMREQGKFVQLAVIDRTLKDTVSLMKQNVETVIGRGETVDSLVKKTEDLNESSKLFLFEILPCHKRLWFYLWGYLNCSWCQGSRSRRSRDHIV